MWSMGTAGLPAAYVLDSFALLSDFGDEPRANMVGQRLEKAQHERVKLFLSGGNIGHLRATRLVALDVTRTRAALLRLLQPWVQCVAQAITEHVER
jgi:hypothetical protein